MEGYKDGPPGSAARPNSSLAEQSSPVCSGPSHAETIVFVPNQPEASLPISPARTSQQNREARLGTLLGGGLFDHCPAFGTGRAS